MTDRMTTLIQTLTVLVESLSGAPVGTGGTARPFAELGFDPLRLTRLANGILLQTGVAIASQRLTTDLSTIDALAAHVTAARPASNAALDALLSEQLAVMERVMAEQLQTFIVVNGFAAAAAAPATDGRPDAPALSIHQTDVASTPPAAMPVDAPQPLEPCAPPIAAASVVGPRDVAIGAARGVVSETIDTGTTAALRHLAAAHGATLLGVLVASVQLLMGRLRGTHDIAVAVPDAAGTVNIPLTPGTTFADHLAAVERALRAGAIENGVHAATANVSCRLGASDATRRPMAMPAGELDFTFIDGGDGLRLDAVFDADVHDAETIRRWLGHLLCLLRGASANPHQALERVPILDAGQRRWLLETLNDTARDYPRDARVHQLIETQAQWRPSALAVCHAGRTMSYGELDQAANQLAHYLRARVPGGGVRIAVAVERSIGMLIAWLAVWKAGDVCVPLDPAQSPEHVRRLLAAAPVAGVIVSGPDTPVWTPPGVAVIALRTCRAEIAKAPAAPPLELVADVSTSAATVAFVTDARGAPMAVETGHRALVNLLLALMAAPGFAVTDHLLAATPVSEAMAALELLLPLIAGGSVTIASAAETADPAALVALIEASGATIMHAAPSMWVTLLDAGFLPRATLKMLCNGTPDTPDLATRLAADGGAPWLLYGDTACAICASCGPLLPGPTVIGEPVANTQIYVLDAAGEPQPPGISGDLWIGGDGLAAQYLDRPDLDAIAFRDFELVAGRRQRLFRMPDRARRLVDGTVQLCHAGDGAMATFGAATPAGNNIAPARRTGPAPRVTAPLRDAVPAATPTLMPLVEPGRAS